MSASAEIEYYAELRLFGKPVAISGTRLRTPWPMTTTEGWGLFGTLLMLIIGGTVVAWWFSSQFIEPSLWWLLPIAVWIAALRFVVAPALLRAMRPDNLAERLSRVAP
ncbi:hypothetical protein [Microbacterium aurum]